ncbi:kinase-like domain-containing protein [Suillus bovinus]|uniref:kinase-like domain-containing protein n=1 Tax=Suillus bovinus TaxID=48563 RepID=UPI001B868984|nr:kinase-like domain-containing protein [Suillus bovinus]KAG2142789.1 kinase-like domain-containing protein [Suillus bovinus]
MFISHTEDYPHCSGGYGNVWKCKMDHSLSHNSIEIPPRYVAVKSFKALPMDEKDKKKFITKLHQEVFVWQGLNDIHIVPLYGLFQVVSGLQYLHSGEIVHGDLMPPNVLIDENGNALLADFGLSCLLAEHNTSFFTSHRPGAARWTAPEILSLDPKRADKVAPKPTTASNIYSFGCIMMQVLSGQRPYFNMELETPIIVAKYQGNLSK